MGGLRTRPEALRPDRRPNPDRRSLVQTGGHSPDGGLSAQTEGPPQRREDASPDGRTFRPDRRTQPRRRGEVSVQTGGPSIETESLQSRQEDLTPGPETHPRQEDLPSRPEAQPRREAHRPDGRHSTGTGSH